ncbi:putative RDD family membrane protein YckC [Peribacillus deserti]|uniref:RDD family membrane protein YckC n=1 Tax=Peribacillus deserti TaxID=673318 RepID=A0ABS2QIC2_9BACI|nr:RDD family protein [Peribacillus deserti]MBM7692897.1 putative RDD family membrane protein YckC [Peribacillus deserti]
MDELNNQANRGTVVNEEETYENNLVDSGTLNVEVDPHHFAGFWMRFWAYLLDLLVIWSISRLLVKPAVYLLNPAHKEVLGFSLYEAGSAIVFYLYFVLMVRFFKQTIGKMVFGLKVISLKHHSLTWGTIIFRELVGRFISKFILIGYAVAGFLPKKQGLHDIFADTAVVFEKR